MARAFFNSLLGLLSLVAIIWLIQRLRTPRAIDPNAVPNTNAADTKGIVPPALLCVFGKYNWRIADLDVGENHGGKRRFYQLWIPLKFTRNAKSVTVRVNVLRPIQPLDRRPPEYSWKVVEFKNYLEGDKIDIQFASISDNRQQPGFYGDRYEGASYISGISKHLFEIDVFFDGGRETTKIYLENPPPQVYANPDEGLGKIAGTIILQENENVFESKWIAESRAAARGERSQLRPKSTGGFGLGPFGSIGD